MVETEKMLETIIANTYTRNSLAHRLDLAKGFLEYYFFQGHENRNLIYLLNEYINLKKENRDEFNAMVAWSYPFFNQVNKSNFYGVLSRLETAMKALDGATIYLPIILPPYEHPKLCGWFRANVHPRFIIDLRFDRSLIGGCAIVYKGVYHNFSLRYFLERDKPAIKSVVEEYLS